MSASKIEAAVEKLRRTKRLQKNIENIEIAKKYSAKRDIWRNLS
jgi:hypothetical protein